MTFQNVSQQTDDLSRKVTANDNRNKLKAIIEEFKVKQDGEFNRIETIVEALHFIESIPEKYGYPDFEVYAIEDDHRGKYVAHHILDEDWCGFGDTMELAIIGYANYLLRKGVKTNA